MIGAALLPLVSEMVITAVSISPQLHALASIPPAAAAAAAASRFALQLLFPLQDTQPQRFCFVLFVLFCVFSN